MQAHSKVITCSSTEELKTSSSRKALDPQYRCSYCGKNYCSLSSLKIHKIRHKSKEDLPFSCQFCPYKCATKRDYLRHHNQHIGHARQTFKCGLCDKLFKISSSLSEHMKSVHTREIKYQCGICNFATPRRSTIRAHLSKHDKPDVQIVCPICMATFLTKANLKNHLMTHAGARPFTCKTCNKKFALQNRLDAHEQAVHSNTTFQCERCDKSFSSVHNLNRHSRIHTGERPFNCCFCEFNSNTQGNLVKHVRKVHKMLHFTYKDILRKRGESTDPIEKLTESELLNLAEKGRKVSESHLKTLKERGLTTASLEQLQREQKLKNDAKELLKLKMEEKRKAKTASKKLPRNDSKKVSKPQKTSIIKEENRKTATTDSFYLSNCDFILPKVGLQDGTYVIHGNDVDVLPDSPAIHVVWNVSGLDTSKADTGLPKIQRKSTNNSFSHKTTQRKCKNVVPPIKKKIICEDINLSHSSRHLNSPSIILEDNYVTLNDKNNTHNQLITDTTEFESGANVLVTSLESTDRVDSTVDFEEIGPPPNTIVTTSDGISDIDRMYRNIDLYSNQFIPTSNQLMPVSNQSISSSNQLMPVSNQPIPTSNLIPVSNEPVSSSKQLTPDCNQAIPNSYLIPVSNHPVSSSNHLMPVSNQAIPTSNHLIPVSNEVMPTSNQLIPVSKQISTSNQPIPTSNQPIPTSNELIPASNQPIPTSNQPINVDSEFINAFDSDCNQSKLKHVSNKTKLKHSVQSLNVKDNSVCDTQRSTVQLNSSQQCLNCEPISTFTEMTKDRSTPQNYSSENERNLVSKPRSRFMRAPQSSTSEGRDSSSLRVEDLGLHRTTDESLRRTSDVSLHRTSDVSLHRTSDVSLHRTSDLGLHRTSDLGLHRTTDLGLHRTTDLGLHRTTDLSLPRSTYPAISITNKSGLVYQNCNNNNVNNNNLQSFSNNHCKTLYTDQNLSSQYIDISRDENSSSPILECPSQVIIIKNVNEKVSKEITAQRYRKDESCNEIKEIRIKNSVDDSVNDYFDVMSIAEVDGIDQEVVLVVDA